MRPQATALLALPLGIGLILAGQALEGGSFWMLFQGAAALIVFGGTAGAVLLSCAWPDVRRALAALGAAFTHEPESPAETVARLARYAAQARRAGMMSIDPDLEDEPDPFLRRGLALAIDGANRAVIQDVLGVQMDTMGADEESCARVYEIAGGYAPTLGILGAVIGLIQVMENLADPSMLGPGIAIAFVATVYGVGSANLVLLPIAARLRERARSAARRRELIVDGVLAIQEGLNPRLVEQRLLGFVSDADQARLEPLRRVGAGHAVAS